MPFKVHRDHYLILQGTGYLLKRKKKYTLACNFQSKKKQNISYLVHNFQSKKKQNISYLVHDTMLLLWKSKAVWTDEVHKWNKDNGEEQKRKTKWGKSCA